MYTKLTILRKVISQKSAPTWKNLFRDKHNKASGPPPTFVLQEAEVNWRTKVPMWRILTDLKGHLRNFSSPAVACCWYSINMASASSLPKGVPGWIWWILPLSMFNNNKILKRNSERAAYLPSGKIKDWTEPRPFSCLKLLVGCWLMSEKKIQGFAIRSWNQNLTWLVTNKMILITDRDQITPKIFCFMRGSGDRYILLKGRLESEPL